MRKASSSQHDGAELLREARRNDQCKRSMSIDSGLGGGRARLRGRSLGDGGRGVNCRRTLGSLPAIDAVYGLLS